MTSELAICACSGLIDGQQRPILRPAPYVSEERPAKEVAARRCPTPRLKGFEDCSLAFRKALGILLAFVVSGVVHEWLLVVILGSPSVGFTFCAFFLVQPVMIAAQDAMFASPPWRRLEAGSPPLASYAPPSLVSTRLSPPRPVVTRAAGKASELIDR